MSHLEGLSMTVMPTVAHIFAKAEDGSASFGWVIGRTFSLNPKCRKAVAAQGPGGGESRGQRQRQGIHPCRQIGVLTVPGQCLCDLSQR